MTDTNPTNELTTLTQKLDAALRAQTTTVEEVQRLGRDQRDTSARLTIVEDAIAVATATARVAMQTATELRADVQRSMNEVSTGIVDRLEKLERTVHAMGTSNEAHAERLEQTLGETRRQTPMIRHLEDRTARYAAIASAFGTAFAYAVAEILRHLLH